MVSVPNFPAGEEWLELAEDPTYLVSTYGRLYDTVNRRIVRLSWQQPSKGKRRLVWNIREHRTSEPSRNRQVLAARAVLRTFHPEVEGIRPVYLDGDPGNIVLDNLGWGFRKWVAPPQSERV
jgi:hypothetical protein